MSVKTNIRTANPAGRAYHILKAASDVKPGTRMRDVWAQVLGISADDTFEIRYQLAQVIALLGEAQRTFNKTEGGEFDDPFPTFIVALSHVDLDTAWSGVAGSFSKQALSTLALASRLAEEASDLVLIETETLKDWSSRVDELLQEVSASAVNDQLKETIAEQLNAIRMAILYYRFHGTEGLRKAVLLCWGALLVHGEEVQNELSKGQQPATGGTLAKVIEFLKSLTGAIKVVKDVGALLPVAKALLTVVGSGIDGSDG